MIKKENIIKALRKIFNSRLKVGLFIILILFLVVAGWRIVSSRQQTSQYQTAKVEKGTIISSVSVSGQILNANLIKITTSATGIVKQVFVKDGEKVFAGQKILEITLDGAGQQKNAAAWASYLAAKNSLEQAKASQYSLHSDLITKWKTFVDLAQSASYQNPDGSPKFFERTLPQFITVQDDWLSAEAKYKNQIAAVFQAEAALGSSWLSYQLISPAVSAPIAGTISNLSVVAGMNLTGDSQKVAVIQNQDNPLASFNLSEIDVLQVKVGQKATITIDSLIDKTFSGKVASLDREGVVTSGVTNYPTVIQFDTEVPEVLPNMAASASIIIESKDNVLLVPSGAVQTVGSESQVRVLKNGQEQEVTVETGLTSEMQTEIVSGLIEGDEVITNTVSSQGQQSGTSPFSGIGRGGSMFIRPEGGGR